jgi:hypothetical protein
MKALAGSAGPSGGRVEGGAGRGLHSFTLEFNSSNSRTHSWVKVDGRAQVELKSERV